MVAYLDKEAVLKAVKDAFSNPEHIVGLLMRIERGEFDAKSPDISQWQLEQYNIAHEKSVADKDSEIARLNYLIAGYHEAIAVLRESKDQEIKDLGEALRKAEKAVKCDGCHPKPCSGCRWENERCKYRPYAKGDHSCRYFEEPPKDEPELVICPKAGVSALCTNCSHRKPHEWFGPECSEECTECDHGSECIPYKEPAKAKDGSMDLPETAKEIEKEIRKQVTEAINSVPGACLEGEIRIEHIPSKATQEQKIPTHYACCDNVAQLGGVVDALEVDIGDLTLRMDLVDSRQAHDFRMITHLNKVLSIVGEFGSDRLYKIEERIGALEKKVK